MAGLSFSGVRPPADWRRRALGVGLILLGVGGVWLGVDTFLEAWSTNQAFQGSTDAQQLAREAVEPTPIWLAPATPEPLPTDLAALPTAVPPSAPILAAPTLEVSPTPTPARTARADQLSLDSSDFRFLDPPEPGAHARIAISLTNHADVSSGRVLLGVNANWFDAYSIIGTAPGVSDDSTDENGLRTFSFPPVGPGATATYELHVTSTEEGTTAPKLSVLVASGDSIGDASPSTQAPPPRPGPVMAIDIPRLKMHTGVLQAEWEAPPFAVGQIKRTAHITEGNTVLVGHLTGAAGNVFQHLDQLQLGDDVTAVSRGVSYPFVVSRIFVASNTDTKPIDATSDARLTLMTCAGVWNPFTRDYSERLWVVAEPPDQAAETLISTEPTATAEAQAHATATMAAASTATARVPGPTPTLMPTPIPLLGEISPPGGLGNTRGDLSTTLGGPAGQTAGGLQIFRQAGREYRAIFSPDSGRAAMLVEIPQQGVRLTLDVATQDARRLLPQDSRPRSAGLEGNAQFAVERFSSASLDTALGSSDISAIYVHGQQDAISSVILGIGDDFSALIQQSRQ